MFSANFLPQNTSADVQVFTKCDAATTTTLSTTTIWNVWRRPKGATMVHILALGGGGGGGAGFTAGAVSASPGGGGGASGCQTSLLIPAMYIPDCLYIKVGIGGAAGVAAAGGAGGGTFVAAERIVATGNIPNILLTANAGNGGGTPANGTTAGAAGTAGGTQTAANSALVGLGLFQSIASQAGIIGGLAIAGANLTIPTTGLQVTGGCGGGGQSTASTSTAGGSIIGAAATGIPRSQEVGTTRVWTAGGAATTAGNNGNNGRDGQNWLNGMFYFLGGGGGSSSFNTTGGVYVAGSGGAGGIGCGGGGGGGCFTGGTRSQGGRGGDGIVIVTSW